MENDAMQHDYRMNVSVKHSRGVTLLEILIAFIIVAIGLLGIASLLIVSIKANNSSYVKQQAVVVVQNILERIYANPIAALSGNYNYSNISTSATPSMPGQPSSLCNVSACSSSQMASYDIWDWMTNEVARLPGGSGSVSVTPGSVNNLATITVTVQWDDSQIQTKLGAISTPSSANAGFASLTIQSQL